MKFDIPDDKRVGMAPDSSDDKPREGISNVAKKLAARRGTMMPPKKSALKRLRPPSTFKRVFKWWQKASVTYAFSHPYVRSRLEKLMGTNVVSLTDRTFMQHLQEKILQDYLQCMLKRIAAREYAEKERVKKLVLSGKIPMDQSPPEMANHPVKLIDLYCQKLIAERRAKLKIHKVIIPRHLYWDDTYDPPSGLSIEKGHVFRKPTDRLCHSAEHYLNKSFEEEIERGYMFTDEEFEKLHFELPAIKLLREAETVDELYALADQIIGTLKTLGVEAPPSISTEISAK